MGCYIEMDHKVLLNALEYDSLVFFRTEMPMVSSILWGVTNLNHT